MKWVLVCLFGLLLVPQAEAGRRCRYRTFQTLQSNYGWSQSCLSCHKPHAIPHPNAGAKSGGWMEALAVVEAKKAEFSAFNEALGKVGINGSSSSGYNYSGEATFAPYAQPGSTYYSYGQATNHSLPAVDMHALYDMEERLVTQAQTLAGQAAIDASMLIQQEGAQQAEVARILAQGQAAEAALRAARGESIQPAQLTSFKFTITESGEVKVERADSDQHTDQPNLDDGATVHPLGEAETLASVTESSCNLCHSGPDAKGKLDIPLSLRTLEGDEYVAFRQKLIARINHTDPTKRMPLKEDLTPGEPLSWKKRVPFYLEGAETSSQ